MRTPPRRDNPSSTASEGGTHYRSAALVRARSVSRWIRSSSRCLLWLVASLAVSLPAALAGQDVVASSGRDVLISSREDYPHVEPHMAVPPDDSSSLLVAAMALPVEGEGFQIRTYRSRDGGHTWSGQPVTETSAWPNPYVDPWLGFGSDGTVYLVHLPGHVWRSSDGGESWAGPALLPRGEGAHFDATKLAVDRSGGDAEGRVYVAATQTVRREDEGSLRALAVLRSADGGETFDWPNRVLPNDFKNKNGDLVVLPDGTLVATFHELFHGSEAVESPRLWSVRSTDGGGSFSAPSLITSGYVSLSPILAVDRSSGPRSGRLYAVWLGLGGDRSHYLAHSDDAGATWSSPVSFATRRDSTLHPTSAAVAVGPEGTVGVFWPEPLPEVGKDCFELRFSASLDGGESFTDPAAVSDEPYCSDTARNRVVMSRDGPRGATIAERFEAGGDYHGLVALPDGSFQAVWADARTGVFQLWTDRVRLSNEN